METRLFIGSWRFGSGWQPVPEEPAIILIVLGVLIIAVGVLFVPLFCGVGGLLLIVGLVLMATHLSGSQQVVAPGYGHPAAPPYGYPPPGAPRGRARPDAPVQPTPLCPVCGTPISWVPQYGRWYCSRCQAYR